MAKLKYYLIATAVSFMGLGLLLGIFGQLSMSEKMSSLKEVIFPTEEIITEKTRPKEVLEKAMPKAVNEMIKAGQETKEEIKEKFTPTQITISSPQPADQVKGAVQITGQAIGLEEIEFYLKQGIAPEYYIGETKVLKDGHWQFVWPTQSTPNGEAYLYAKDKYSALAIERPIRLIIDNPVPEPKKILLIEEKAQEFKQTAQATEEIKEKISQEAKKIEEIIEKNKEIKEEAEEKIEVAQKIIEEAKTIEEPTEKIKENVKEAKKNIEEANQIKGRAEKLVKDKQELVKEITEVVKELEKTSTKIKEEAKETLEKKEIKALTKQVVNIEKTQGKEKALEKVEELITAHQTAKQSLAEEIKQTAEKVEIVSQKIKEEPVVQASHQTAQKMKKTAKTLEKAKFEPFVPNTGLDLDSDGDGLSDLAEAIYGTHPNNPDTDGDGYLDGVEIKHGHDPLKPLPTAKITYEEPTTAGVVQSDIYQITAVENIKVPIYAVITIVEKERPIFKGRGLPNSFVTLYIYSALPIVVTTRVDSNGQWSYTLSKPLSNGRHQVYVGITNNTGQLVSKSEPHVFFILEAKAVSQEVYAQSLEAKEVTKSMFRGYFFITLGIILIGLIITFRILSQRSKTASKIIRKDYP